MKLADKLGLLAAPDGPQIHVVNGMRMGLDHSILTHRLMFYDLYEENVMNFLKGYLKPGMTVFDPGANLGYFAAKCLGWIRPGGRVISFEPSHTCLDRLKLNADLADWELHPIALTDHVGEMTFYDTPRVISRGYACLEGVADPKDRIEHPVHVTTIDRFCEEKKIRRIDFLKLDIERSELPALKGAQRMIAEHAIPVILIETTLLTDSDREAVTRMDLLLRNAGYSSFQVERNGRLRPIDVLTRRSLREDIIWKL